MVRIELVPSGFPFLAAACLSACFAAPADQGDARLSQAAAQVARDASRFWQSAPALVARETLRQKAVRQPRRKFRVGASALGRSSPALKDREVLSYYAFSAFSSAPEALHEFREIVAVDGHALESEPEGRRKLIALVESAGDGPKRAALRQFERECLDGTATDFGQLILLFTRANQPQYSFALTGSAMAGAERALVIEFHQLAGSQSLHISEGGKAIRKPLEGQLWVREGDLRPLRITLSAGRQESNLEIRDEAAVDYAPGELCVLPASVVCRRFVNGQLTAENVYQYAAWEPRQRN